MFTTDSSRPHNADSPGERSSLLRRPSISDDPPPSQLCSADVRVPFYTWKRVSDILACDYIHTLLICWPLAVFVKWSPLVQFWLSIGSLPGLNALIIRFASLQSTWWGGPVGGVTLVIFESISSLVTGAVMISHGEARLLEPFITGSILYNTILATGCCFCVSGVRYKEVVFNGSFIPELSAWLGLAVSIMLFPSIANTLTRKSELDVRIGAVVSLLTAVVLLSLWVVSLVCRFQTHEDLFEDAESEISVEDEDEGEFKRLHPLVTLPVLAMLTAVTFLTVTMTISTIDKAARAMHTGPKFLILSFFPFAVNLGDLLTSMKHAYEDRLGFSLGQCIAGSLQYPLLLAPIFGFIGYVGHLNMQLNFGSLEIVTLFLALVVCFYTLKDGKSNYFRGILFVALYIVVVVTYALLPYDSIIY